MPPAMTRSRFVPATPGEDNAHIEITSTWPAGEPGFTIQVFWDRSINITADGVLFDRWQWTDLMQQVDDALETLTHAIRDDGSFSAELFDLLWTNRQKVEAMLDRPDPA